MLTKIMVIDAGHEVRNALARFSGERVALESFSTVSEALERRTDDDYDLVFWNVGAQLESIAEVASKLRKFAKYDEKTPFILVSELTAPEDIISWRGEYLWLTWPFLEGQLRRVFDAALESALSLDGKNLSAAALVTSIEFEGMIAVSMAMRMVFQQIVEAAAVDVPVLITGETGTGKDLVAAAIHKRSNRKNGPYLPVNMGAIAPDLIASELFGHEKGAYTGASEARPGFFEQAQHGTLFLDEITTMDAKTQVSLLRVLETKALRRVRGEKDINVDVRVIAATNEVIEEAVKAGRFREDLNYRLDVFGIHIPPLRERSGGVTLLTEHFVSLFNAHYHKQIRRIPTETYRLLRHYNWPGNVRELKNVIQRAVLMAKSAELTPDLLPGRIREAQTDGTVRDVESSPIQLGMTLADVEKEYIKMTINSVGGNKLKAAEVLDISRRALYNKLKRHGLI